MPSRQDEDLKYANKLVAVLEKKLEESELQVEEYRRFCEEIVSSDEKDLTYWKRRAQFTLDAMKNQIRLSEVRDSRLRRVAQPRVGGWDTALRMLRERVDP
jgi:hypothetical protein